MSFFQNILITSICIALSGIMPPLVSAKPLSPVQVSIMPANTSGQSVEFVVQASVTIDAENLQITVSIPRALNVLSGELHWQGTLLKGEEKQLRFSASLSEAANTFDDILIQVHAAIGASASAADIKTQSPSQFAANAFYRWQTGVAKAAAVQSSPLGPRIVDRGGLQVQEYELRP